MTTGTGRRGRGGPRGRRRSRAAARPAAGCSPRGRAGTASRAELLWVDILAGEVHTATVGDDGRLEPVRTLQVGRHVGAAAPAAAGGYVLAAAGGFWHADDDGGLR